MEDFQPRFLKQMWKVSSMRCGWAVGFSCMGTKYSIPHFNSCIRDLLENVGLNGERGTRARALKALGRPPPPPCPDLGPVRALQRDATSPSCRSCGLTPPSSCLKRHERTGKKKIHSFPSKNRTAVERSLSGEASQVSVF